jgi:uncharacterized protein
MGFYAAMKLRLLSWSKLLQTGSVDHGLLLPILFHCVDDAGQPMIGPLRARAEPRAFAREAGRIKIMVTAQVRRSRSDLAG